MINVLKYNKKKKKVAKDLKKKISKIYNVITLQQYN